MAPTSFDDLPLEVIAKIVDFVVISKVPFYAQHAINLARELKSLKDFDDAHPNERRGPPPKPISSEYAKRSDLRKRARLKKKTSTACHTDVKSLMNAAFPSQKPHLQDWIIINSTCQRIRAVGKRGFFSQKVLFFDLTSFWNFCAGKAAGISSESQALAVSCARTAIVHLVPKAVDFMRLPRIQRQLPMVQRLGIYSCSDGGPLYKEDQLANSLDWTPLPERLEKCLRNIGFDMDSMEVGFLYRDVEDNRRRQVGWLERQAYAGLDACATFIRRTQAASKAVGPSVAP